MRHLEDATTHFVEVTMRGPCMLLILLQVLLYGCADDAETDSESAATSSSTAQVSEGDGDPDGALKKQLRSIVILYANSVESNRRCDSIEDLKSQLPEENWGDSERQMFAGIESGEIVVRWGLNDYSQDYPGGDENTVIAYQRDVPTNGGWVVMADMNTYEWTAAEFQEKLGQDPNSN